MTSAMTSVASAWPPTSSTPAGTGVARRRLRMPRLARVAIEITRFA